MDKARVDNQTHDEAFEIMVGDDDDEVGPQPPISDEPPIPDREELPGTPRPASKG